MTVILSHRLTLSSENSIMGLVRTNISSIGCPMICGKIACSPDPILLIIIFWVNTMWNGNVSKNTSELIGRSFVAQRVWVSSCLKMKVQWGRIQNFNIPFEHIYCVKGVHYSTLKEPFLMPGVQLSCIILLGMIPKPNPITNSERQTTKIINFCSHPCDHDVACHKIHWSKRRAPSDNFYSVL